MEHLLVQAELMTKIANFASCSVASAMGSWADVVKSAPRGRAVASDVIRGSSAVRHKFSL